VVLEQEEEEQEEGLSPSFIHLKTAKAAVEEVVEEEEEEVMPMVG